MAAQTEVQMTDHLGSREWGEGTEDIGSRTQKKESTSATGLGLEVQMQRWEADWPLLSLWSRR